jgi:hypothetical protein
LYFSDNHAFEGYYRTIGEAENTFIEKKNLWRWCPVRDTIKQEYQKSDYPNQ